VTYNGRTRDTIKATVSVANTGSRAGDLVVPLYVAQPVSSVLALAFTRVTLNAGESRSVVLQFPASRLAVTPGDVNGAGGPRVASGDYQLISGASTSNFTVR
jgi:beta-glucosidase